MLVESDGSHDGHGFERPREKPIRALRERPVPVRLIAHRGFAAERPENTLGAVRRAVDLADAVEVDARRCGSGEVVVVHDETVDRVTDGSGRVDELSRAELAALSVLGSDEGVPTLGEVTAAIPANVGLVLELKEVGLAEAALDATVDVDDLIVSSFLQGAIEECRAVDPGVRLALNVFGAVDEDRGEEETGDGADEVDGVDLARELGCVAVHPHYGLCSARYVERAQDAGLSVNAWTVEDRETAREVAAANVDGVIADRADVLDQDEP